MRLEVNAETNFDEDSGRWYNETGRESETCLRGAKISFTKNGMKLNGRTN